MASETLSKITDNVFLSSYDAISTESVQSFGITHIINATFETPNKPENAPDIEFTRIRADDSPSFNMLQFFDFVADKIDSVVSGGGKVLVHCMAGVSRSATLVIAYLMKHKNMNLKEACEYVSTRRPIVKPNEGF